MIGRALAAVRRPVVARSILIGYGVGLAVATAAVGVLAC